MQSRSQRWAAPAGRRVLTTGNSCHTVPSGSTVGRPLWVVLWRVPVPLMGTVAGYWVNHNSNTCGSGTG